MNNSHLLLCSLQSWCRVTLWQHSVTLVSSILAWCRAQAQSWGGHYVPLALSQAVLVPSPLHGWKYARGSRVLTFWASLASLLHDA